MEDKKIEVVEEEIVEVEEIEETKEGLMSKAMGFVKKNGKKLAIGVAAGAGLLLAYGLGKRSSEDDDDYIIEDQDDDAVEVEFTEIESE